MKRKQRKKQKILLKQKEAKFINLNMKEKLIGFKLNMKKRENYKILQ